jgi:hypothetical protein
LAAAGEAGPEDRAVRSAIRAWLPDGLPGNGGMLAIHVWGELHHEFARQILLVKSNGNANGLSSIFDYSGRTPTVRWGDSSVVVKGERLPDRVGENALCGCA